MGVSQIRQVFSDTLGVCKIRRVFSDTVGVSKIRRVFSDTVGVSSFLRQPSIPGEVFQRGKCGFCRIKRVFAQIRSVYLR